MAIALLASGLTTVQTAAVSGVQVKWADGNHRVVRVSWQDVAEPNHVEVLYGAADSGFPEFYLEPEQPNTVDIPIDKFALDLTARIAVSAARPGQPDAGTVFSPWFDTSTLPWPKAVGVYATGGTATWAWTAVAPRTDHTPRDPLDLPATPVRYLPLRSGSQAMVAAGPVTTARYFRRSDTGGAYRVGAAALNEWAPAADGITAHDHAADIYNTTASLGAPSVAGYGTYITIYGQAVLHAFGCLPSGACGGIHRAPSGGRTVRIEARKDSRTPWQLVRQFTSAAHGVYRIAAATPGTRQYRVVVRAKDPGTGWMREAVSRTATVTARTRVLTARFRDPTVSYRQRATVDLAVTPAGSQRALLQRKGTDGVYRGVAYVQLRSGRGSYTLTATPRGTRYYRFYIPPTTVSGYSVAGAFAGPFPLTVR